jgi:sulfide dehydrogenase cytochrome subunit
MSNKKSPAAAKLFVLITGMLTAAAAAVADMDAIVEDCNGCHGPGGVSEWNDMPTIAGLSEFYHADQLYIYRDGDRPCAESEYRTDDTAGKAATTMCAIAEGLSDDEIDAIAAHYAEIDFVAAAQEFDPELASAGETVHADNCAICHSDGGSNPDDDAGILAGQWTGYLQDSFDEYFADERPQPGAMKQRMDALSEEDAKALLHYYAGQQ